MDDLFEDTVETLTKLQRAGFRMGVISNWNRNLPDELARLGVDTYFDFVIASAIVGVAKPSPEIFHIGLRAAACQPQEALYVGDNVADDCAGAHGVGMDVALIDRSDNPMHETTPCTRVFSSLKALADHLLNSR
jgi:putative hydrolase of the HAD superfamily